MTRSDIVDLCNVLHDDAIFTCREKWPKGASGSTFEGVGDLKSALQITADSLGPNRVKGVNWLVLDDSEIKQRSIGKKALDIPKPFLGFFSFQEDVTLFAEEDPGADLEIQGTTQTRRLAMSVPGRGFASLGMKSGHRGRRGLLANDDTVRSSLVVQHAATPALGAMSTFAGGCASQCRAETSYYYSSDGKGVQVYVVDGIVMEHAQFKDMDTGKSRISKDRFLSETARESDPDCAGDHATHVAGIAAGFEYGTSKKADIVSVAVQPGCEASGMASDLIEGLEWIRERQRSYGTDRPPAVVSMSLILQDGTEVADLVKDKILELVNENVVVVVAAGNFHEDACDFVPANIPDVITVAGASVFPGGGRAIAWSWSNYGECVDVFAPAVDIESANPECYECTAMYSGTSQATPFVTGLVAQYLSVNPRATPAEVKGEILKGSTDQFLEAFRYPYESTPKVFAQSLINLRVRQVRFAGRR
jgi:subtilisin family serine protease